MPITRRETLVCGSAVLLTLGLGLPLRAQDLTVDETIDAFVAGRGAGTGNLRLDIPAVAEDGFKVPIEVIAEGAEEILIIAPENPVAVVARVAFGPLAAKHRFASRIRLARTQEVLALARMQGGGVLSTHRRVDVVIGGCGA